MKTIAAAISINVIDVPRSGSSRISPTNMPTTSPIGTSAYDISSMRSIRRSRIAAMKKIALSLASSDGWMPMPPNPNHRLLPLMGRLNSTPTSARVTTPIDSQMNDGSR